MRLGRPDQPPTSVTGLAIDEELPSSAARWLTGVGDAACCDRRLFLRGPADRGMGCGPADLGMRCDLADLGMCCGGCGVAELGMGRGLSDLGMGCPKRSPVAGPGFSASSGRAFLVFGSSGLTGGIRSPRFNLAGGPGPSRRRRHEALQTHQHGRQHDCCNDLRVMKRIQAWLLVPREVVFGGFGVFDLQLRIEDSGEYCSRELRLTLRPKTAAPLIYGCRTPPWFYLS